MTPDPELLEKQLGVSASTFRWRDRDEFEERKSGMLQVIQSLILSKRVTVKTEQESDRGSYRIVYELDSESTPILCHGSATFGYMPIQEQGGFMSVRLFWNALPGCIEELVAAADTMWDCGALDALYAYDKDDFAVQNITMPFGSERYGLDATQVKLIKKGPDTLIDTRHNPGFFEYREGLHVSVQWLNYWSVKAQKRLFGGRLPSLPACVEITELANGAVRVRLAERPGRYDDVAFHELQLECRRRLGLQK